MFMRQEFAIFYIFLLDTQCTTFYNENRIVKRANVILPFALNSFLLT